MTASRILYGISFVKSFVQSKSIYLVPCFRVKREGKERRRLWAQRKTRKPAKAAEAVHEVGESGTDKDEDESLISKGMLPSSIVSLLAAREKYGPSALLLLLNLVAGTLHM